MTEELPYQVQSKEYGFPDNGYDYESYKNYYREDQQTENGSLKDVEKILEGEKHS